MTNQRDVLLRLFRIHRAIEQGDYPSLRELSQITGVSKRQMLRDIDSMKEHGADIKFSKSKDGYYYQTPFHLMPCEFTPEELQSLLLALEVGNARPITSIRQYLEEAIDKIRKMRPSSALPYCSVFDTHGRLAVDVVINYFDLAKAVENGQQVMMVYESVYQGEQTERVVDPHYMMCYKGIFYVYGYCHLRHEKRIFALHRIKSLALLPQRFAKPDLQAEMREADERFGLFAEEGFYNVVVEFEPESAKRMRERIWHPSQTIEELPDGSIRLSMQVRGLTEVTHWVLGFGCFCKPIAPAELVERVRGHVVKMMAALSPEDR